MNKFMFTCGMCPTHFDKASKLTGLMTWSDDLSTLLRLTPPEA